MKEDKTIKEDHNPTPWEVISGSIYDANGTRIALMDRENPDTSPTERDRNAHFLVKAVNSYTKEKQEERREQTARREELEDTLKKTEFALDDIREASKFAEIGSAYEHEKLQERDKYLTQWMTVTRQLAKLPPA